MANNISRKSTRRRKKKKAGSFVSSSLLFIVFALLLFVISVGVIGLAIVYSWVSSAAPLDYNAIFDQNQTTYIVDKDNKVIDELHSNENRSYVNIDKVPLNLQKAIVAIEDKRFYEHGGFDLRRMFGALFNDIKTMSKKEGASTITQQLIKNVYLSPDKAWKRKIVEIYYAIQLERRYTKPKILEAYMNTLALGHNNNGVQAASLYYFGKNVWSLNLAESAMLAGITRNPSFYSPIKYFDHAKSRQELVLKEMFNQGEIIKEEYDTAVAFKIKLLRVSKQQVKTSYFSDMVISDVLDAFVTKLGMTSEEAKSKLYNGGLRIVSTIDPKMQTAVEKVFENKANFPSSMTDKNGVIQPQSAFVLIENGTGNVKAIMGGRSTNTIRGLNRATQSKRQPGSSIKPLSVYAPAIESGYSPASIILDAPTSFGSFKPSNVDGKFRGYMTIRSAITQSVNIIAIKLVNMMGVEKSAEYLRKFHINSLILDNSVQPNDMNLSSMALGGVSVGVKPIEMAAAYSAFPNQGIYVKPISFTKILDKSGNLLFENNPESDRVLDEKAAFIMVSMMQDVVKYGTATNAKLYGIPAAGKTGTTTNNNDIWFIGYTPYFTGAVWMGYDEPRSTGSYGGVYPAKIWKLVMTEIHKGLPKKSFPTVDVQRVTVCKDSGLLPGPYCASDTRGSRLITDYFMPGTIPNTTCDVHVEAQICTVSGRLATEFCPQDSIISKVFIQRKETLQKGSRLLDDLYVLPTKFCNIHTSAPIVEPSPSIQPTITPTVTPTVTPEEK